MKLYKDSQYLGEFTNKDEAKLFLMWQYNQSDLPEDMPPTAEECEAYYHKTGNWTNWFEFMGVTASYHEDEEVDTDIPITIICKEHGDFVMTPRMHLAGHGCPDCEAGILLDGISNKIKQCKTK